MLVSRETAHAIARTYAEIESAEGLIEHLAEAKRNYQEPDFRDDFGRQRGLQLGVPSGSNSLRLMDVPFPLAEIVIKAHLDAKRAELAALSVKARLEIEEHACWRTDIRLSNWQGRQNRSIGTLLRTHWVEN